MQFTKEIWKDIPNYEGLYQVSSMGRLISTKTNKLLKPRIRKGYVKYVLCKDRIRSDKGAHQWVMISFVPNTKNLKCINHKNGIKTDNRVENLEWCDQRQNIVHAYDTGLSVGMKGGDHPLAKLTINDVNEIRMIGESVSSRKLGSIYGVSKTQILYVRNHKSWSHIK